MSYFATTKRRLFSCLGAMASLAIGATAFIWLTNPAGAMQAGGPGEAVRFLAMNWVWGK